MKQSIVYFLSFFFCDLTCELKANSSIGQRDPFTNGFTKTKGFNWLIFSSLLIHCKNSKHTGHLNIFLMILLKSRQTANSQNLV